MDEETFRSTEVTLWLEESGGLSSKELHLSDLATSKEEFLAFAENAWDYWAKR